MCVVDLPGFGWVWRESSWLGVQELLPVAVMAGEWKGWV